MKRTFSLLSVLSLLLWACPLWAATYTQVVTGSFGTSLSGQAANLRITVYDSAGTAQIAATNSPSGNAIAESTDAAGNPTTGVYIARFICDTAWLPVHYKMTIVGQAGVSASAVIGTERAAAVADGYTAARGANLANLDTASSGIKSQTDKIGQNTADSPNAVTAQGRLDVAVSTRSTYAGGDTAGTTTLLGRLTATRAGLFDNLSNLDALVSSRLAGTAYTAAPTAAQIAAVILATPANLLQTDAQGRVTFSNTNIATINGLLPPVQWNLMSVDGSGRVLLQPTQTGVTIPTVTSVTNAVALPSTAPAGYGGGTGLTTNELAAIDRLFAMTNVSNQFTSGAFGLFPFPADYLTSQEQSRLLSASTAQQTGIAVTLPASVVPAGDVTTIANASSAATLAASVASGVTLQQAIVNSMRNLKSYQAPKDTVAHTQLVKYFIPGTSDSAAAAGTGTVLFTATVHFGTDNSTLLYTTYN